MPAIGTCRLNAGALCPLKGRSPNGSATAAFRIVTTNLHSAHRRILSVSDAIERTARAACHSQRNQRHPPALSDFIQATASPKGQDRERTSRSCAIAEGKGRAIPLVEYQARLTPARARLPTAASPTVRRKSLHRSLIEVAISVPGSVLAPPTAVQCCRSAIPAALFRAIVGIWGCRQLGRDVGRRNFYRHGLR